MRYFKGVALIAAFCFLCGFGGGGNSGGGSGSSSCSGDINAGCSQVTSTHLASALPANQGGVGNALQYVINDRGTTTTPACDWTLGYICRFAAAGSATVTQSNVPGSPTAPAYVHILAYINGANATISFPSTVFGLFPSNANATASPTAGAFQKAGGGSGFTDFPMWCDGTNCFLLTSNTEVDASKGYFNTLSVATSTTLTGSSASTLVLNGGGIVSSTGGTAPTATCSGGSTGVVVSAGNTSCTGSTAPFPCCTGSGTGTCSNSTDNKGTIQTSSSASTSCTITFNHTWPQTPMCVFDDGSSSITPTAFAAGVGTTTTYIFNFASTTSKVVNYVCL